MPKRASLPRIEGAIEGFLDEVKRRVINRHPYSEAEVHHYIKQYINCYVTVSGLAKDWEMVVADIRFMVEKMGYEMSSTYPILSKEENATTGPVWRLDMGRIERGGHELGKWVEDAEREKAIKEDMGDFMYNLTRTI